MLRRLQEASGRLGLGEDGMVEEVELSGGVANKGAVVRIADTVRRPASPHSSAIAALLGHLESVGFRGAPRFLGFDEAGREMLSWIPGDVPLFPFPAWAMTDDALRSLARLLRAYHEAVEGFSLDAARSGWSTELAEPSGGDLVCHNDVCPENVVFRGGEAVALLDFDFAAPGTRIWDVVAAVSHWAPLTSPEWSAGYAIISNPVDRAAIFADEYGLDAADRGAFMTTLRLRWEVGRRFVRRHLEAGDAAFEEMALEYGAEERWEATDRWLDVEQGRLEGKLLGLT
jgi:hypothetical protein